MIFLNSNYFARFIASIQISIFTSNFGFFLQIGQLLATTEWKNQAVRQHVQDAFVYGSHNSLCLAHGRKPIQEVITKNIFHFFLNELDFFLQYVSYEFPQFTSLAPNEDIQCAINSPRSSSTSTTINFTIFLATIFQSILK